MLEMIISWIGYNMILRSSELLHCGDVIRHARLGFAIGPNRMTRESSEGISEGLNREMESFAGQET